MNIGSSSFIERLLCSDLLGRLWKPFFVDGHAHVCAFFFEAAWTWAQSRQTVESWQKRQQLYPSTIPTARVTLFQHTH